MSAFSILWSSTSANVKTGPVPTAFVGATKEEGRASCAGCPLLDAGCYAHSGSVALGAQSMRKAAAKGADRSLKTALANRSVKARMVRLTGIGDIGRCGEDVAREIVTTIKATGLDIVGYTHHWREAIVSAAWKGHLLASTESMVDADTAVSQGWRASVVVPKDTPARFRTPAGHTAIVCPAQVAADNGRQVTCNDCRLCAGSKRGPVIAFRAHGNQAAAAVSHA